MSRDETPDTTGLREAMEALAAEHWDWKAGQTLHRRLLEVLAAHPTPDASPDPECVICRRPEHEHRDRNNHGFAPPAARIAASLDPAAVTPHAGDVDQIVVATLAKALGEHEYDVLVGGTLRPACKCGWAADHDWSGVEVYDDHVARAILASDWLANHVAAAREADRAEVEAVRAELSRQSDEAQEYHVALHAAEAVLAGLVAQIEAEAARMSRAGGGIYTPDFIAGFQHAARVAGAES